MRAGPLINPPAVPDKTSTTAPSDIRIQNIPVHQHRMAPKAHHTNTMMDDFFKDTSLVNSMNAQNMPENTPAINRIGETKNMPYTVAGIALSNAIGDRDSATMETAVNI